MGAPLPDAPPPAVQDAATAAGSFEPSAVPAAQLCGFKLPLQTFPGLIPKIPSLGQLLPFLPIPTPALAFNCNLDNPLAMPAKPWGGGRTSVVPHDPDDDFEDLSPGS